jgi:hypothetical protein
MKIVKITLFTAIFLSSLMSFGGREKHQSPSEDKGTKKHELQVTRPTNPIEENECPICMEIPSGDNTFLMTPCCQKKLCRDCRRQIQETYDQSDPTHRQYKHCPFCRADISTPAEREAEEARLVQVTERQAAQLAERIEQARQQNAGTQTQQTPEEIQIRESGAEIWLDPVSRGLFFRQPGETPGSFILTPTQNGIPPQVQHQNTNH